MAFLNDDILSLVVDEIGAQDTRLLTPLLSVSLQFRRTARPRVFSKVLLRGPVRHNRPNLLLDVIHGDPTVVHHIRCFELRLIAFPSPPERDTENDDNFAQSSASFFEATSAVVAKLTNVKDLRLFAQHGPMDIIPQSTVAALIALRSSPKLQSLTFTGVTKIPLPLLIGDPASDQLRSLEIGVVWGEDKEAGFFSPPPGGDLSLPIGSFPLLQRLCLGGDYWLRNLAHLVRGSAKTPDSGSTSQTPPEGIHVPQFPHARILNFSVRPDPAAERAALDCLKLCPQLEELHMACAFSLRREQRKASRLTFVPGTVLLSHPQNFSTLRALVLRRRYDKKTDFDLANNIIRCLLPFNQLQSLALRSMPLDLVKACPSNWDDLCSILSRFPSVGDLEITMFFHRVRDLEEDEFDDIKNEFAMWYRKLRMGGRINVTASCFMGTQGAQVDMSFQ